MSIFDEPEWKDDGHIIEITKVKPDDYVEFTITCPGEGKCAAGSLLCDDWDEGCDHGVVLERDYLDELVEVDCPTCKGTGKKDGRHHCWLLNGNDNHEALQGYGSLEELELGRYKLLLEPSYEAPEDYFVYLKVGEAIQ